MGSVLLIEDEPVYSAALAQYLRAQGYEVQLAECGDEALATLRSQGIDLVLLDLSLPDIDGMEICRVISRETKTPVIIVSAKDDLTERVLGLELGADDFVDKCMAHRELLARIRAVQRRANSSPPPVQTASIHGYEIDLRARRIVNQQGERIELTHIEFEMIRLFVREQDSAVDREQIYAEVWSDKLVGSGRTIDTHVRALRKKLPNLVLTTVRGVGYRLESNSIG